MLLMGASKGCRSTMKPIVITYLAVVFLTSLVAFAAYGIDKRRARRGTRRVPERTLQWMALLGGWPGALAGQRLFRHKTQKTSFRVVFWLVTALHLVTVFACSISRFA